MEHILLPLDGSEKADVAIKETVKMAKALEAKVTLFYVIPSLEVSTLHIGYEIGQKNFDREKGEAEDFLLKCKEKFGDYQDNVEIEVIVGHGVPDEIATYADQHDISLIVIGTQGTGMSLKRMLVGSVTKKLLTITKVPVLVVD